MPWSSTTPDLRQGRLIVLGGLPGTGKTTLGRTLAGSLGAFFLRIDTVEQALRACGRPVDGPEGYVVAYGLAEDNLRLGRTVVADSVNPLPVTRDAWRAVASRSGARLVEIEVTCSDPTEHRRRVETRHAADGDERLPTWQDVLERDYRPWRAPPDGSPPLVVDAVAGVGAALLEKVLGHLGE